MPNRIEVLKATKDGLDALPDLLRYAETGIESAHPDDIERFKWYGLFHRKATPGYFMLRLRIPNGTLTSEQIAAIGEIANRCGRGQADITTRQNIQLRWITIADVPWIITRLASVGLTSQQSGMDNVRNIVGCPLAGLDPDELFDARTLSARMQQAIIGHKGFSNLPRKFNIAITGCREDCIHAQAHDLSFTAATRQVDGEEVAGFNVLVGGALGGKQPRLATSLDAWVTPDQVVAFALAVLETFRDAGPREKRQQARLKVLLDDWGTERFRAAVAERFGQPLVGEGTHASALHGGDHLGVRRQRQPGMSVVGCLVPVGRITGDQLIAFADLARRYGQGEVRLTVQQNVLIPHVPDTKLKALLAEPLLATFSPTPSAFRRSVVSCTGTDFCHFSLIDTKNEAVKLAQALEERFELDEPIRVNMSGCPHACGQHRIGEIGLLGDRKRVGDVILDAADIFAGGKLGQDAQLGDEVASGVLIPDLPEAVARAIEQVRPGALRRREVMSADAAVAG